MDRLAKLLNQFLDFWVNSFVQAALHAQSVNGARSIDAAQAANAADVVHSRAVLRVEPIRVCGGRPRPFQADVPIPVLVQPVSGPIQSTRLPLRKFRLPSRSNSSLLPRT